MGCEVITKPGYHRELAAHSSQVTLQILSLSSASFLCVTLILFSLYHPFLPFLTFLPSFPQFSLSLCLHSSWSDNLELKHILSILCAFHWSLENGALC